MSSIVLLDTSIYLNILNIAGSNQARAQVLEGMEACIENNDWLRLPMATIWETGNHISNIRDGGGRFKAAQIFAQMVASAIRGESPYKPTWIPSLEVLTRWLEDFPAYAKVGSLSRPKEGLSFANFSVIQEWEDQKARHPQTRVWIWSLAKDLVCYDTG